MHDFISNRYFNDGIDEAEVEITLSECMNKTDNKRSAGEHVERLLLGDVFAARAALKVGTAAADWSVLKVGGLALLLKIVTVFYFLMMLASCGASE